MKQIIDYVPAGAKFAVVGLTTWASNSLRTQSISKGRFFVADGVANLPADWGRWLGTLREDSIRESNLLLFASMPSSNPTVQDAETKTLTRQVTEWYTGMLLTGLWQGAEPFILTGYHAGGEFAVRSFEGWAAPSPCILETACETTEEDILSAARIGEAFEQFEGPWQREHWRLLRCLNIYQRARSSKDVLDRIHQFTRCIEGLIAPEKSSVGTGRQFKEKSETLVGSKYLAQMADLYEIRGKIEHLNEDLYLADQSRDERERLTRFEFLSERVAREMLAKIFKSDHLIQHFGSRETARAFWNLPSNEQKEIWGNAIDLDVAIQTQRKASDISDEQLGIRLPVAIRGQ